MPSRRAFLLGLGASLAAPAVVRAELIMPIRKIVKPYNWWSRFRNADSSIDSSYGAIYTPELHGWRQFEEFGPILSQINSNKIGFMSELNYVTD